MHVGREGEGNENSKSNWTQAERIVRQLEADLAAAKDNVARINKLQEEAKEVAEKEMVMTKRKPYCCCNNPELTIEQCPHCSWNAKEAGAPGNVRISDSEEATFSNCPACGKCIKCGRLPKRIWEKWWPERV